MIQLKNLSKHYQELKAVNQLTLSVPPGEIFGFIGPNGAGKTTTILMMAGLMAPTFGSVTIDGIDMARHPVEAKKKIGLIPDRPYLYEKLTGMEFLRFTADLYHVRRNAFTEKAKEFLSIFSLHDRADELIESYSHGMKQRLIMAAALIHDPALIIVDEPMVGLDPRAIKTVRDLFKTLAENGATIFISTHTLKLAEELCDRIGVIHKGSLVATGTLSDLKETARLADADLEKIFFQLTEEEITGEKITGEKITREKIR
ncbi:MAG: ABC transporter ATP-binding protein [Desulfobacterales bacterium]|nr:ABC transporter ATP-binding protein [Desulfobacterales bacterium]